MKGQGWGFGKRMKRAWAWTLKSSEGGLELGLWEGVRGGATTGVLIDGMSRTQNCNIMVHL